MEFSFKSQTQPRKLQLFYSYSEIIMELHFESSFRFILLNCLHKTLVEFDLLYIFLFLVIPSNSLNVVVNSFMSYYHLNKFNILLNDRSSLGADLGVVHGGTGNP